MSGFPRDFEDKLSGLFPDLTFFEWLTHVNYRHYNTKVNTMKAKLSILNKILWKCMSKDQVWNIIFLFKKQTKIFFPDFSRKILSILGRNPEMFQTVVKTGLIELWMVQQQIFCDRRSDVPLWLPNNGDCDLKRFKDLERKKNMLQSRLQTIRQFLNHVLTSV